MKELPKQPKDFVFFIGLIIDPMELLISQNPYKVVPPVYLVVPIHFPHLLVLSLPGANLSETVQIFVRVQLKTTSSVLSILFPLC